MSLFRRVRVTRPVIFYVIPLFSALLLTIPAWAQSEDGSSETSNTLTLTLDTGTTPPPANAQTPVTPVHKRASLSSGGRLPGLPLPSRNGVRGLRQQPLTAPKVQAQLGCTVAPQTLVRVSIDSGSRLLSKVPSGTYIAIIADAGTHYGVLMANNTVGWTPKTNIELMDYKTQVTAPNTGDSDASSSSESETYQSDTGGALDPRVEGILREAFTYLGVPYVWGGTSRNGLDCSAFVRACFRTQGIDLPRHSGDQIVRGRAISDDLRAGDRLYFDCSSRHSGIDHTGIYLGRGLFIHASGSHGKVVVESLNKPKYLRCLVAIRRDFE